MIPEDDPIPIFPLSNVVLFPGLQIPLHVFEPRYRQMVEAAMAGDKRIGMVVVRPESGGDSAAMGGDPPVYAVGCAGIITNCQAQPDGRYNIVLLGTRRFRISEEETGSADRLYRVARIKSLEDALSPVEAPRIAALRSRVSELLVELLRIEDPKRAEDASPTKLAQLDDVVFTNALCNAITLQPRDKQQLLEADAIGSRLERLVGLMEFRITEREATGAPGSNALH
jgi:Lon protease-like protein